MLLIISHKIKTNITSVF